MPKRLIAIIDNCTCTTQNDKTFYERDGQLVIVARSRMEDMTQSQSKSGNDVCRASLVVDQGQGRQHTRLGLALCARMCMDGFLHICAT